METAMQVISDLVLESLDESQVPTLTTVLLPTLMTILKNETVSSLPSSSCERGA
jgi:hypothetical protein